MKISLKEVDHIARLARLRLSGEDPMVYARQLSDILAYIDNLNELDTSDVEPTSHVLPMRNVFRGDVPEESLSVEDALRNAPLKKENFYRVPKIIE